MDRDGKRLSKAERKGHKQFKRMRTAQSVRGFEEYYCPHEEQDTVARTGRRRREQDHAKPDESQLA